MTVVLDESHERHIRRVHPEVARYLERLCEALDDPTLVCFRERTQGFLYYRRGLMRGSHRLLYLVIAVTFVAPSGQGLVKTMYLAGVPASDKIVHVSPNILGHGIEGE